MAVWEGIVIYLVLSTRFGKGWESSCPFIWEGVAVDLFQKKWLFAFLSQGGWDVNLFAHLFGRGWQLIHLRGNGFLPFYPKREWPFSH